MKERSDWWLHCSLIELLDDRAKRGGKERTAAVFAASAEGECRRKQEGLTSGTRLPEREREGRRRPVLGRLGPRGTKEEGKER